MATLRQLVDPAAYRRCDWDLGADPAGRTRWCSLFRWHLDAVAIPMIRREHPEMPPERLAEFRAEQLTCFDEIEHHPERFDPLDIITLTEVRNNVQARYGIDDPFHSFKQGENDAALALLPEVLAELDSAGPERRRELLATGLMAGNIVDFGSKATIERHHAGDTAFRRTRASQPPRPWRYDDLDTWWQRWESGRAYRHAVFFIDNAGADILLGCIPLARWILRHGTRLTLAANSGPALNDITAAELEPLLARAAEFDTTLAESLGQARLGVAATGNRVPLLDLTALSAEFVARAADADLLILHGMGRGIESNFHATFNCDALRTAVLKDEGVATRVGGRLFECVFRFTPAGAAV